MGVDVLMKWKSVFSQTTFLFTDILHWLGWYLALGLKFLCDAAQTLVDEMYKLLDFTSYGDLSKFFTTTEVRILLGVIFAFALTVLGVSLIWQKDKERPKVLQNLLIAVMVITALPSLMTMMNSLTLDAKNMILNNQQKLSDKLIADNVVDLLYIDSQGFDKYDVKDGQVTGGNINGFQSGKSDNIRYIDPNEKITEDYKNDLKSPNYFFNVIDTNPDGTLVVKELKADKFLGIDFTGWYYRYHVDYAVIYIALAATTIAFFLVAYKVAKLIFELAVHGILATIFSAGDLTNGEKTKHVLKSIGSIYLVLVLAVLMIKLYYLATGFISSHISNGFIAAIALIFFAFAVADGPNIVERTLGIDVGLKSGFQSLAMMFIGTRVATNAIGGVARFGGAAVGTAAGLAGGFASGVKSGKENLNNQTNNKKSAENNQSSSQNNAPTNNLYGDNNPNSGETANAQSSNLENTKDENNPINSEKGSDALNQPANNEMADSFAMNTPNNESAEANNLKADNISDDSSLRNTNPLQADNIPRDDTAPQGDKSISDNKQPLKNNSGSFDGRNGIKNRPDNMAYMNNPRSTIGSTQRGYYTGKGIGNALGRKTGEAIRKREDKNNLKKGDK